MTRAADMPPAIEQDWPAICLVRPQMGENIGAVARVMLNFGLTRLRIVEPRDRWPNPKAEMVASGAEKLLESAQVDWRLADALADANFVIAATARPRGMEKPVLGPRQAAVAVRAAIEAGQRPVLMFGAEANGLSSEEVAHAHAIVSYPVNPAFASLNLANAVAIMAFAIGEARQGDRAPSWFKDTQAPPAPQVEFEDMMSHLEGELERGRFFHPPDKAPVMRLALRNLFLKARMTEAEVRTFRGVIKALVVGRGGRKLPDDR